MLVGDGPLRASLEEQAASLGIRDRLIFTGAVAHADMPRYLAAMDICVVPHSNAYRSPIKLFEYMARGRAVVAPRTEPIALIVRHLANGLLFDPESPEEMRTQLATLSSDPALQATASANKRARTSANTTPGPATPAPSSNESASPDISSSLRIAGRLQQLRFSQHRSHSSYYSYASHSSHSWGMKYPG